MVAFPKATLRRPTNTIATVVNVLDLRVPSYEAISALAHRVTFVTRWARSRKHLTQCGQKMGAAFTLPELEKNATRSIALEADGQPIVIAEYGSS
jgi:hypothetical protein